MTNPMPETSVIPTFHKLRTCRSLVFDTQEQLFRLENLERRVALGRVIRLHPDLPPTLVVAEGQPYY